jgi:predicted site-specific integrase-resolvase
MTLRESERRQRQREASQSSVRVVPWLAWCELRGISLSTAERLQRAGKIKVTWLSPRRKGVREDHDREYLASCTRGRA